MLEWFEAVEFLAWEKVNKYWPGNRRPQRIFCVTGQTLSSTYAIAHSASSSAECLVTLEAKGGFPDVADAEIIANYKIDKAHATYGFQQKKEALGDEEYVLFLDPRWSGPMRSFRHVHLQRLKELYRCTTANIFITDLGRFFKLANSRSDPNRTAQRPETGNRPAESLDMLPEHSSQVTNSVEKVKMEPEDDLCQWHLIKSGDDFGIQYSGPEADVNFKPDLTGNRRRQHVN